MTDYYNVLGVSKDASEDEIKKSYRKLARKYHPDVSEEEDATSKFQELQEAYSVLKDPQKRRMYDLGQNPNGGFGSEQRKYSSSDFSSMFDDIAKAFRMNMGGRRGSGGFTSNVSYSQINISLEEAFTGTTRTIDTNTFRIPSGVRTGTQLALDGIVDVNNGYSSRRIVVIVVNPHKKYKRSNDDLLLPVTISAIEAMVGTEGVLNHIDGTKVKFKIPKGTQQGQVLRLEGKGMPNPEIDRRGDLLIQVYITIPEDLTSDELESIMSVNHRTKIEF